MRVELSPCTPPCRCVACPDAADADACGRRAGEKLGLNIFEPRYRLMVRRCMEGNRRFGMATLRAGNHLNEAATECEITECQPQPDGCGMPIAQVYLRCQR